MAKPIRDEVLPVISRWTLFPNRSFGLENPPSCPAPETAQYHHNAEGDGEDNDSYDEVFDRHTCLGSPRTDVADGRAKGSLVSGRFLMVRAKALDPVDVWHTGETTPGTHLGPLPTNSEEHRWTSIRKKVKILRDRTRNRNMVKLRVHRSFFAPFDRLVRKTSSRDRTMADAERHTAVRGK
ncbi:MAG: hypothetical protein M1837_004017 [Sclerophora amabilis]|nr:MAG: hypothetical protein M1837_004017 [Sclerophora amabilis]